MSTPTPPTASSEHNELHAALFAQMVVQQSNLALIFLGAAPHPETGKRLFDLDTAQMFIAQLDMLEAKTNGNLSPEESALLKERLSTVRMAFVQAVNGGDPTKADAESEPGSAKQAVPAQTPEPLAKSAPEAKPSAEASPAPGMTPDDDERKKFVKKY